MKITHIAVCGNTFPIGIDEKKPFFSWQITGTGNDIFQKNYRITVSKSKDFLNDIIWDSGIVNSSDSTDIRYGGEKLEPDTRYFFYVTATVNGKIIKSDICCFITGLLGSPIRGSWLTSGKNEIATPETCIYVRKNFSADCFLYATLNICSYGWYELYINGLKPDSRILSPSKGNYNHCMFYETYDITDLLNCGENVIALALGDGYNSNANIYMGRYKGEKRFAACINLHKSDGTVVYIPTDSSWKFTADTPIISNNIYNGELYDARLEKEGWNTATDFDDSDWEELYISSKKEKALLYCDTGPFIKIIEEKKPYKVYCCGDGRYMIDFGQNLSGFVKINLSGKRGTRIRIKTAERIRKIGKEYLLDAETNRAAAATDTYIFKGAKTETYYPHFTYHGFRYAEITGLKEKPSKNQVVACVVHTEFENYGGFETDNPLINQIYSNALWSVRSNSFSFPSDCAARDERTPCAMDLFCYLKTAMYMRSPDAYYSRFLKYLFSAIKESGNTNMTWSGCVVALPWFFMKYYGNLSLVEDYYSGINVFVRKYLAQNNGDIPANTFGDWCAPNAEGDYATSFSCEGETEYYMRITVCRMMAEMAGVLNKRDDSIYYTEAANSAIDKFKNKYLVNGVFSDGKQSPNLYALSLNIIDVAQKTTVGKALIDSINRNEKHLDTGIFGIMHFIEVFSDLGLVDAALECFMNPEYPSFANQINRGATTLWEQWCGKGDMSSNNHAMFAGAVSGFYTRLAGITPIENGFKTICVKPTLSKYINILKVSLNTVNGTFKLCYKAAGEKFDMTVSVPPNSHAEIILPNGERYSKGNGTFKFSCAIKALKCRK